MAKIFIYGSCVSRDAFEFMSARHNLIGYVARQALISALSPGTKLLEGSSMKSSFQNRMLEGDIASNLMPMLRRYAEEIDLILMDLTDERFGIHKLADSSFVTRSNELISSKRLEGISPQPGVLRPGTDRHWMFWERASFRFAEQLERAGLKSKVLVVNAPWATMSLEGVPVPESQGMTSLEMTEYLSRCASQLQSLGLKTVTMPEELSITTTQHKWGIAPYHFANPAYDWIVGECEETLSAISCD